MIPVSWHALARRELFRASDFYEKESVGLGEVFLDAVALGIDHLKLHPRAGRKVLRESRRYLVARFPYSIVYRVELSVQGNQLFILAVAHQKRRPLYWTHRVGGGQAG